MVLPLMVDRRASNGPRTCRPIPTDGATWVAFLASHGRRIQFRNDGCWIWTGATFRGGYGAVRFGGVVVRAHRLAWTLRVGALPPSLTLDHLCRRTACINPDHMELVDAGENRRRAPISGKAKSYAAMTHCAQGHPFDGHDGRQRRCSQCHRKATREHAARTRAARKVAS